ncbi:hypothetical protein I302_108512 [Kwoniella bestiolae CBS 10118]|uniref:Uncharacterized protein n=1 Tax=Kwoniella bestiolae CBS 10118 TaxID=1296100 RepID=A0A1B9FVH4_9TREE|nr:hypothetical protein I302_07114 [Kwoniella bestiolae CBS 10118]OCF22773.1 hypothetical protein I302_07114 [Kwoniella bestiolae CBS 10118]
MPNNHPEGSSIKRPIVIDDEVQVKVEASASSNSSTSVASTLRGDPLPEKADRQNVKLTVAGFGLQIYLHGEAIGLKGIAESMRPRKGAQIVTSPWIDKLAFTGKTPPYQPYQIKLRPSPEETGSEQDRPGEGTSTAYTRIGGSNPNDHADDQGPRRSSRPLKRVQFFDEEGESATTQTSHKRRKTTGSGRKPLGDSSGSRENTRKAGDGPQAHQVAYICKAIQSKPPGPLGPFLKRLQPELGVTSWLEFHHAHRDPVNELMTK